MTPFTPSCSRFSDHYLRNDKMWARLVLVSILAALCLPSTAIGTNEEIILLTDGTEMKIHTRDSTSISSSLGYKATQRITALDFRVIDQDLIQLVWLEGWQLFSGLVCPSNKSLSHTRVIETQPLKVAYFTIDKSCQEKPPSVFVIDYNSNQENIHRINSNGTFKMITSVKTKPGELMKYFEGNLYWKEGSCILKLSPHVPELVFCFRNNINISSWTMENNSVFVLTST